MRILVVDDSRAMRALIIRMLQQLDQRELTFREAENGRDALEIASTFAPDLVVCDLNMDDVDGIEVLRELRQRGNNCQFGLISSEGCVPATRERALAEGASFVLSKPFQAEMLWNALVGGEDWDIRTAAGVLEGLVSKLLDGKPLSSKRLVPRIPDEMAGARVVVRSKGRQIDLAVCGNQAAQEAVGRAMLGLPQGDTLAPATVADCMAELANMLAGGLKARLAGDVQIGLPELVSGRHLAGSGMATELGFDALRLTLAVSESDEIVID